MYSTYDQNSFTSSYSNERNCNLAAAYHLYYIVGTRASSGFRLSSRGLVIY